MTTPTFERESFLLTLLGQEAYAELRPVDADTLARIDAFLATQPVGPVTDLVHRALDADGGVADEEAFAQLQAIGAGEVDR